MNDWEKHRFPPQSQRMQQSQTPLGQLHVTGGSAEHLERRWAETSTCALCRNIRSERSAKDLELPGAKFGVENTTAGHLFCRFFRDYLTIKTKQYFSTDFFALSLSPDLLCFVLFIGHLTAAPAPSTHLECLPNKKCPRVGHMALTYPPASVRRMSCQEIRTNTEAADIGRLLVRKKDGAHMNAGPNEEGGYPEGVEEN
ncbi:hypothetical protein ACRALDRAFT_206300 [Sodiomyces alcalophilus JCM 7366]|uniref:uncharacterized protein n=1 Tax=Sodiomyces alcalophilus JCM 7366 TaxID=591952 RepID=UPI0039B4752B